jgi:hypothetical protein
MDDLHTQKSVRFISKRPHLVLRFHHAKLPAE